MRHHLKKIGYKSREMVSRLRKREQVEVLDQSMPRITNETVAEHREEVLSGARKYIYPLQHSKHRIVLISSAIFIAMVIGFVSYSILALYKFQNTTGFIYRVTQVIPYPISQSKAGFVSYESYLFELRHYMHYYQTQQKLDFKDDSGKQQLTNYKKLALQKVVDDSFIKQLARQNNVSITNKEVDREIAIVRSQNRLGANEKVFEDVLRDFWGWSINDFRRSLREQLLAQKVAAVMDTATNVRAQAAINELNAGASFADIAKKYSDDQATKNNGGDFGIAIDKANRDLAAQTTEELYKLQPNQYSPAAINIGYALEIIKNTGAEGNKFRGAHILFNFKPINQFISPLKEKEKTRQFIKV